MAKKATEKKPSTEILDDNGTLIATSDGPRAKDRGDGGSKGRAKSD
jgi:hypothetical protein